MSGQPRKPTVEERFWAKVDKDTPSGCWMWTAHRNQWGYGVFSGEGRRLILAHRFSFRATQGPTPEGKIVCHTCDNPACVNPAHLYLGTHWDNAQDCVRRGRRPRQDGERNYNAKVTQRQVKEIRKRYANGEGILGLAAEYPVGKSQIYSIVKGQAWRNT